MRKRTKVRSGVLVVCVLALMGPVGPPTASSAPVVMSDNVELVANIPDLGAIGGQIIDDILYMTTVTGVRTFDISMGVPVPLGALALPHLQNESVSTNGELLLVASDQIVGQPVNLLHIVDVSNPRVLLLRSSIVVSNAHTATCIADCRYAWTSGADVVDLTDPSNPVHRGRLPYGYAHKVDVDEAGYAWVNGSTVYDTNDYGDHNILSPTFVAGSWGGSFGWHGTLRPDAADTDGSKLSDAAIDPGELVLGTDEEWFAPWNNFCQSDGPFITSHLRIVGGEKRVQRLDSWRLGQGTLPTATPVNVTCTSHWFDYHEDVVANAWMGQGTRFLSVEDPRNIRQVGYFMPAVTQAWMALFHEVPEGLLSGVYVYVFDAARGLDVLRFTGSASDATMLAPHYNTPDGMTTQVPVMPSPFPQQFSCDLGRSLFATS